MDYHYVTPHVGVWIETDLANRRGFWEKVTPHVGAWIEIQNAEQMQLIEQSLPMWERGLKLSCL